MVRHTLRLKILQLTVQEFQMRLSEINLRHAASTGTTTDVARLIVPRGTWNPGRGRVDGRSSRLHGSKGVEGEMGRLKLQGEYWEERAFEWEWRARRRQDWARDEEEGQRIKEHSGAK